MLQLILLQIGGEDGKNIDFYGKIYVFPLIPANLQPSKYKHKNLFI
jgi:hypothetical protein